jgi:pilus assembly protein CpaC
MLPISSRRRNRSAASALPRWLAFIVLAGCLWCARQAFAGDAPPLAPACPAPGGAAAPGPGAPAFPPVCPAPLPPTPERPPRPPENRESVRSFVESLSTNDSAFEVLLGQGRILTLKEPLRVRNNVEPLVAVGDPTVIDVIPVNARQIRVIGLHIGVSDLSITTAEGRVYNFEVHVVADLDVLRAKLRCLFPDASLKLAQVREHIVVEGQARDTAQVARIIQTIEAYLRSVWDAEDRLLRPAPPRTPEGARGGPGQAPPPPGGVPSAAATPSPVTGGGRPPLSPPAIINLIRVPGSQQVLLKVRVAELNRTGMRQIGGDFLAIDPESGAILGTQIGGATVQANAVATGRMSLTGTAQTAASPVTTVFGIFQEGDFAVFLSALRRNSLLKILAEPNLVALNGHQASFLAGGEFPVPVPQTGGGGIAPTITVQFKEFGVRLGFVPYILDGDVIRLTVDPEVSTINFAIGTTLVAGGSVVPGLDTRKAHTVVEMRQGQTLAIAGLLQLSLDGTTQRIPVMGDLPIIGPFFSNTTSMRTEKELIVLVTPYLVEPMNAEQVPPGPGDEVKAPNDLEFYLLNRIEGRTGRDFRATTEYDDPLHVVRCLLKLHQDNVQGPHGFCD